MPQCVLDTSSKGNERNILSTIPYSICAAGVRSTQPNQHLSDAFDNYSLQDEVDALLSDAIIPVSTKYAKLPPLRRPPPKDYRHLGLNHESHDLLNPPIKSKFQEIKLNCNKSNAYCKNNLEEVLGIPPGLPSGPTFQRKIADHDVLPVSLPDIADQYQPGYRKIRNYNDSFNPNKVFGIKTNQIPPGWGAKCALIDDRDVFGTLLLSSRDVDFKIANKARLEKPLTPCNNKNYVPEGHRFGKVGEVSDSNVSDCLTYCNLNHKNVFLKKCLGHLNAVRNCISKLFLPSYFNKFYLKLKYIDKYGKGWLPTESVYNYCLSVRIRFKSELIEPLLTMWDAFDGHNIKYETFVSILNYRLPLPSFPKVSDIDESCLEFKTTYGEMVRLRPTESSVMRAGLPSSRFFDKDYPVTPNYCCKATRHYLPEESDVKSCLSPSFFTHLSVSHRDMYAVRELQLVRKVFEAAGEAFTDDEFKIIWDEATKYHSQGLVSYETFRRALNNIKNSNKLTK